MRTSHQAPGCGLAASADAWSLKPEKGQVFVEYTMILGLVTVIIVVITGIIVPAFGKIIANLVQHVAVYVSSI